MFLHYVPLFNKPKIKIKKIDRFSTTDQQSNSEFHNLVLLPEKSNEHNLQDFNDDNTKLIQNHNERNQESN